VYIYSFNDKCL